MTVKLIFVLCCLLAVTKLAPITVFIRGGPSIIAQYIAK